ncbi:amidase family protein [Siccirubricoccus deserti]
MGRASAAQRRRLRCPGAAGGRHHPRQDGDDLATRHPGATTNPHNPAHTPGGSSSGSAAGAGAGFFHAGFGTQTAGSIIRPAAFCGAVGFKPSWGTLHRAGMKVMSESLDTIGVITGSVADAASVMTGLTGGDYGDPEAKPARAPKLGLCWGPTADRAAPETRALIERVATAAAKAGATVTALEMPPAVAAGLEAHPLVMNGNPPRPWPGSWTTLRPSSHPGCGSGWNGVATSRGPFWRPPAPPSPPPAPPSPR